MEEEEGEELNNIRIKKYDNRPPLKKHQKMLTKILNRENTPNI